MDLPGRVMTTQCCYELTHFSFWLKVGTRKDQLSREDKAFFFNSITLLVWCVCVCVAVKQIIITFTFLLPLSKNFCASTSSWIRSLFSPRIANSFQLKWRSWRQEHIKERISLVSATVTGELQETPGFLWCWRYVEQSGNLAAFTFRVLRNLHTVVPDALICNSTDSSWRRLFL